MIIALEESGEEELQETQGTASKKRQYDRAKAEDVRPVSYTHLTLPTSDLV